MSVKSYRSCFILYTLFVIVSPIDLGYASPTMKQPSSTAIVKDDPIIESLEEINDLNKNIILRDSSTVETSEPPYDHIDEENNVDNDKLNVILGKMKKDVEILESNDGIIVKDADQLEERYRGPAIIINTDEFINENIEMNAADEAIERMADQESLVNTHTILSIVLVVVALMSIGLYTAVVMWRSHVEQRYGMRQLLVTNDNQDYWPQHMTEPPSAVATHPQQTEQQAA